MPFDSSTATRPRADLNPAYQEINPDDQGLVARELLNPITSPEIDGNYQKIPRAAYTRIHDVKRAENASISQSTWKPGNKTFELFEYAHAEFVDRRKRRRYQSAFDADEIAVRRVRHIIDMALEADAAAAVFNETSFPPGAAATGATLGGGAEWTSASGGAPITDVNTGKEALLARGIIANTLVISAKAAMRLAESTQIVGRMTELYGPIKPSMLNAAQLAALFDIERVILPKGIKLTSDPGVAVETYGQIWDTEYAWLGRIGRGNTLASGGPDSVRLIKLSDEAAYEAGIVRSYDQANPPGRFVEACENMLVHVFDNPAGYLIKNVAA